jgi:phage virion morphogenesis protein
MAGDMITVDVVRDTATPRLLALSALERHELVTGLASLVQEQTRRRIRDTKTAPDGTPWKPNRAGTSTLLATGALLRSIDRMVEGDQAIVGTGLVYARIHQRGGKIVPKTKKALRFMAGGKVVFARSVTIPARPYLGVSVEDGREIEETARDFVEAVLASDDAEGAP